MSFLLLVMFVMLRSRTKVSSTYHRILLCLSISDVVGSFAIALVTLPMPKPGSDRYIDSYNCEGKKDRKLHDRVGKAKSSIVIWTIFQGAFVLCTSSLLWQRPIRRLET